jgi:hypothetical protein
LASIAEGEAPFWFAPEVEDADELSSTVWASVASPSDIACCVAAWEVELETCSSSAALASRVTEATSAPP